MKRIIAALAALVAAPIAVLGLLAAPASAASPTLTIKHGVDNEYVNKDCASVTYSDGYHIGICTYTRYTNTDSSPSNYKTLFLQQTKYYCASPSRIVACQGVYFRRNANLNGVTSAVYGGATVLYRQCGTHWEGVGPAPACPATRDDNDTFTTHVWNGTSPRCGDPWWTQITAIKIRTNGHEYAPAGLRTTSVRPCYAALG